MSEEKTITPEKAAYIKFCMQRKDQCEDWLRTHPGRPLPIVYNGVEWIWISRAQRRALARAKRRG